MKLLGLIIPVLAVGFVSFNSLHNHDLCEGIVEENNMWIADTGTRSAGITEESFNAIIDVMEDLYSGVFEEKGASLVVNRKWDNGTVNAYASRSGNRWIVSMFGGLARHEVITEDGFALVVCHEIGHHIGGAPRKSFGWATNEGQADYWGNLKCLRRYLDGQNHEEYLSDKEVDSVAVSACEDQYTEQQDQLACQRMALAGRSLAYLFQDLRKEEQAPEFGTPDREEVNSTLHSHPGTQCRMDTYFNGGLCQVDPTEDVSDSDVSVGTCMSTDFEDGFRPLCWFKPPTI